VRLRILHTIRYVYTTPAGESHNEVRLMPLSDDDQTCLDFRLTLDPAAHVSAYDLPSGRVHLFDTKAQCSELSIRAESLVVTHRQNPFLFLPAGDEDGEFYRRESIRRDYAEFLDSSRRVQLHPETDRIAAVAKKQASGAGTVPFLMALNRQLYRVLSVASNSKSVDTLIWEVTERRERVCQDFAHLMLAVCRRQGIPARYVSGYLYTGENARGGGAPAAEPGARSAAVDQDAPRGLVSGSAMYAWVECLLPDARWHGFDPTNNLLTNDYYVKVHTGRDYGDVPPVHSVYRGPFAHTLEVSIRVVSDPV
jgi:transglutaminase-like putative cysteine protease